MEKFKIIKKNNHIEISFEKIEGLVSRPKNNFAQNSLIRLNKIELVHPSLIKKNLDKKIYKQLKKLLYLSEDDEASSSDVKKVLDEVERLRGMVLKKYSLLLDEEFIEKRVNRINVLVKEIAVRTLEKEREILENKEPNELAEEKGRSR